MALSTDYVMRTGAFEPEEATLVPGEIGGSVGEFGLLTRISYLYDLVFELLETFVQLLITRCRRTSGQSSKKIRRSNEWN